MTTDPVARDFCTTTHRRRARKRHYCGGCARNAIRPGDIYLMHTEFPGGESGYADAAERPVRMAECASCADRYERTDLLGDVPRCGEIAAAYGVPCTRLLDHVPEAHRADGVWWAVFEEQADVALARRDEETR